MTKILNTTTLTFLQETTFIFYTIAFGWIKQKIKCGLNPALPNVISGCDISPFSKCVDGNDGGNFAGIRRRCVV